MAAERQARMMLAGFTGGVKSAKREIYRMYTSTKGSIKVELPVYMSE